MKNILISLMAAASLVFSTGCGGDACEDIEDAGNSLEDKLEDCGDGSNNDGDNDEALEQCKEALEDCSDSDQEKLSDYASCLQDLPDCEEGELEEWTADALECSSELEGLSSACASAFGSIE